MPFTIDFETGDTSQVSYDGGLSVDTTPTLGGTYCAYVNSTNKYGNIEFTSSSQKIIRLKILRKADLNYANDYDSAYFLHLAEGNQTYDAGWMIYLRRFSGSEINRIGVLKSDYSIYDEVQVFTKDDVHEIEIDYKAGNGDGHFILKVDDVVRFNYTALSNSGEDMSCLHFGLISGAEITGGNLYFDDITDDIGGGPQIIDVGLISETDSALALSKAKAKDAGLASETDSALSLDKEKEKEVGLVSSTETALSITSSKTIDIGIASETDLAQAIDKEKEKEIGIASETDSALGITVEGDIIYDINLVNETDTAIGIRSDKAKETGLPSETDTALPISITKTIELGIAEETAFAQQLAGILKEHNIGLASETDTALSFLGNQVIDIGLATETDAALAILYRNYDPANLTEDKISAGLTSSNPSGTFEAIESAATVGSLQPVGIFTNEIITATIEVIE